MRIGAKFEFDDSGFRKLKKELEELEKGVEVPLSELLNSSFMTRHTSYTTLEELLEEAGVTLASEEDAKGLPTNEKLDAFIAENTRFKDWNDMIGVAAEEYISREFRLG